MEDILKYKDFTLEDMEIIYNYFNGEKDFICDGDNKVIIVEE